MPSDTRLPLVERLRQVAPFDSLPEASLLGLQPALIRHSLGSGERIIAEDSDPSGSPLFAILSARVRLVEPEQLTTVRNLREGQLFGHFALVRKLPPPYRAEISQAGDLLEIGAEAVLDLFSRHPFFAGWFEADLRRFERELGAFDDVAGSRFLFGQRLGELERSSVPECDVGDAIRDVARIMSARDSDCMIVTLQGHAVGVVRDADLRDRVVASGLSTDRPVGEIMRKDLPTIRARASVFDGMMAMEGHGRRHLVLLDEAGVPSGVLGDTDLARTLLSSPAALRRRLLQTDTPRGFRQLRIGADRMIITLYRRGVRAEDLLKINTSFNDALTLRAIEVAITGLSPAPAELRWTWLSLGSEGRGEMGLNTDQDNAIVYACTAATAVAADAWLAGLAARVNAMLDASGIALCDGGIMAREAPMRHTLDGWRDALRDWMSDTGDARLLWVAALTDSRPVFGDGTLSTALRTMLSELLRQRPGFLRTLAREALVPTLPISRFPSLRLRGIPDGDQGPALHLKRQGTHLIVNAARLFCLEAGVFYPVGTGDRLVALADSDSRLRSTATEASVAYGVFADLRLSWEIEQRDRGEPLSGSMPIKRIGETRKRLLIGAYQTVEDIRSRIRTRYGMVR